MHDYRPWLIELVWMVATILLVFLIIVPIRNEIYGFPFEKANALFIIAFVTGLRWLLFLNTTPFKRSQIFKGILGLGSIWMALFALRHFGFFQSFIDDKGIESITRHLPEDKQIAMATYITREFIFFSIGTIIICLMMPFRLLISIWRTHNLNKV